MLEKLFICFIAFFPFITFFGTESGMYNMYILNIMTGIATIFAAIISWHRKYCVIISRIDITIVFFILSSLLSAILNNKPIHPYTYINISFIILFIIATKNIIKNHIPFLCHTLCFSIILLVLIIVTLFFFYDLKSFFILINNKMGNTGVCAIFLAIAICIMSHMKNYAKSNYQKLSFILLMILCTYMISQCECRTALLVIAVYCFLEFFQKKRRRYCSTNNKKHEIVFFIIATLLIGCCILITTINTSKLNSITGRLFILYNSLIMFYNNLLIGHGGFGSYATTYALHQAQWFSSHSNMDEIFILADNVMYANNEYLQTLCETGLCGFTVLITLIYWIIISLKNDGFLLYCIVLPLLCAAAFYYILHVTFLCTIALVPCIIASCRCNNQIIINNRSSVSCWIILLLGVFVTSYNIRHYNTANMIYHTFERGKITRSQATHIVTQYGENRAFMALLATAYSDSIGDIYDNIERNFIHSDVLWAEGRNLLAIGCDSLGEQKLILASKIVPNRFRYNNELLQLYRQQGDTLKCHIIARKILDMPIKVPSPTVSAIKMEAKSILEDL